MMGVGWPKTNNGLGRPIGRTPRELQSEVIVKRRFWLILTMAILFGIEAPICAIACVTGADGASVSVSPLAADSRSSHHVESSCHESRGDSTPGDSPSSDQDCGCDFTVEGLLSTSPNVAATLAASWMSPNGLVASISSIDGLGLATSEDARAAYQPGVPPPDILLLKSTLLI